MTHQMTTYEPKAPAVLDFTGMLEVAKQLVGTGFLPEHIKTPGQCVAIIMAGRELGMEPMQALRSIIMVKGKVVVSADAQLGLFKAAGGRAQFSVLSDTEATLNLIHPNGDTHTETFTIEDAKRAKLTNNPTWTSYPKAMLRSRCITAGLKSVGFEPTAGAYDPEEAAVFTASAEVQPAPPPTNNKMIESGEVERSHDCTAEERDRLLDIIEHPAIAPHTREKVELRLKTGLASHVAKLWIQQLELLIANSAVATPEAEAVESVA